MRNLIILLGTLLLSLSAQAVTIEFPVEELAKESVLPVFEGGTTAVKSRRVITKRKFEVGPMGGFIFNEPYFSPLTYGLHAGYHFNEFHSLHVNAFLRNDSPSDDSKEIEKTFPGQFDFKMMPSAKYLATIDYQLTPYYGKISLSKDFVMNLAMYMYAGGGMIDFDGDKTWIADVGVGQNLFFSPTVGLRFDLKFLFFNGPVYTSLPGNTAPTAPVTTSQLDEQMNISPSVMLGLVVLL